MFVWLPFGFGFRSTDVHLQNVFFIRNFLYGWSFLFKEEAIIVVAVIRL